MWKPSGCDTPGDRPTSQKCDRPKSQKGDRLFLYRRSPHSLTYNPNS
ncbi:hypothetical protein NG799_13570 [Laspinema sp. D1]|uniref:Uncharacterized protein n=1 Tax=Laspinema palackyanum D2a TaxID=2953684 RepID=A0ABT2MU09_9CYAN|nr:hypothetical protein [Laspinema sp. D2a]